MKLSITKTQNIALIGFSIWVTAPIFAYGTGYRIAAGVCVAIWVLLEVVRADGLARKPTPATVAVLIYVAYVASIGIAYGQITSQIQHFIFLFFFLVLESRRKKLETLQPVFWTTLMVLPIWAYLTIGALQVNAGVARMLSRSSQAVKDISSEGVGGYGLVYLSALIAPIALVLLVKLWRTIGTGDGARWLGWTKRALLLANAALGAILVLRAGYTLATIIVLASTAVAFFLPKKDIRLITVAVASVTIAALVMVVFLPETISALQTLVTGTFYAEKVADIGESLASSSAAGTVEGRTYLYTLSIDAFLRNPILGGIDGSHVGGHSAILDQFGRYGLLVGSLFSYLVFSRSFRMMRKGGGGFGVALCSLVGMAILCLFNTLPGLIGFAAFVVVPVGWWMMSNSPQKPVRPSLVSTYSNQASVERLRIAKQ